MEETAVIRRADFGIAPGRYKVSDIFRHLAYQQYRYLHGQDSCWGYLNHYAEYLLHGPRRLKHGC